MQRTCLPVAATVLAAVLAGCGSTQYATGVSTGGALSAPGAAAVGVNSIVIDGGLVASIGLGVAMSNVIVGAMIGGVMIFDGLNWRPPPSMSPGRTIQEVDCTKPVDYSLGNIKCR